ncbi:MAG: response regulator transcription factor [Chloroflexi bacterium]|nr:response regulator transcription factor [Chloroflexota bacterium]
MIRVLLADNHQLLHFGIRAILSTPDNITLIETAMYSDQLWQLTYEHQPDVILLALNIVDPPWTNVLKQIQQQCSTAKILILLHNPNEVCLQQLMEAGAVGGILKSDTPEKLVEAIQAIAHGQMWFSSNLIPQLLQLQKSEKKNKLTPREIEVLQLAATEKTDKEVALMLGITERTVRFHLENSNIRLGTITRLGAVVEAIRCGIIQ